MSLFSFKKKPSISFVFDIRDSSVTLAAVKFEKQMAPEMIHCQTFPIPVQDTADHRKYLNAMLAVLDTAVLAVRKTLVNMGNTENIGQHFFFIGSPWSVSESKTIKVTKDRPFEINDVLLKKIIREEETEAEHGLAQSSGDADWRVVEEKVIRSKLNGYLVENIFGKKAMDLETEMFVSFIPYEMKSKLHAFANAKLGRSAARRANSTMLSAYSFLRETYPQRSDYIYVDLGDFLTDVFMVQAGAISHIASFPVGERDIMQSVLKKAKTSEHLVTSAVSIHRDGNYDSFVKKDFEKNIDAAIVLWSAKLADTVAKLSTAADMPRELFIAPRNELARFVAEEIAGKKGNPLKVAEMPVDVEIVDEQAANGRIANGKAFANEPYVKMDILFIDRTIQQK